MYIQYMEMLKNVLYWYKMVVDECIGGLKMKIPTFLDKDDYLQNPIMKRFLKNHKLESIENRADYIKAIEEYASENQANELEVRDWLLKVVKEGSKDICYKKIYGIEDVHRDTALVEAKIKEFFPECPMKNILAYKNTPERTMIEYSIITNSSNEVIKIEFTFSGLLLYGESGKSGNERCFPVFVEIYLDEGFSVSRGKAKSTLYEYNKGMICENKVDTMDYAVSAMNIVNQMFGFETEINLKRVKNENSQMLYRIYSEYTFTPDDVVEKVNSQKKLINGFVKQLFSDLGLNIRNKGKALLDAEILVEKFISINGNNEDIFKNDRSAYLIKVSADDEIDLTRIDTASDKTVPLQCTEAFFDSKKSVVKSKKCRKLHLIFKRNDELYFTKQSKLVVQLGSNKNYGYIKTMQYAEEVDIQNVLQAIFNNY